MLPRRCSRERKRRKPYSPSPVQRRVAGSLRGSPRRGTQPPDDDTLEDTEATPKDLCRRVLESVSRGSRVPERMRGQRVPRWGGSQWE